MELSLKKKNFLNWVLEHVRPHTEWNDPEGTGTPSIKDSWKEVKQKIKEHATIGIKFIWKF